MTDYLPADIWSEILLKQPIKSLIRFTVVCKSWRSLILSPDFIYAHLSLTQNHSLPRRYDEYDKHEHYLPLEFTAYQGFYEICSARNPDIPFKFGRYRIVGSCHGIICLCLVDELSFNSLQPIFLWNPSVRNHVVLPPGTTNPKAPYDVVLGFGFANHVYKVVRLVCGGGDVLPHAEIFCIGMENWRSIPGFDVKYWGFKFLCRQVLLKGIIHWLVYEMIDYRSYRSSILAFDVGDEVFGEVKLPDALVLSWQSVLFLYKIGESLAVVKSTSLFAGKICDVWVMIEYAVVSSWTKLYRIDVVEGPENGERFLEEIVGFKKGEALLAYSVPQLSLRELVSYNLENKQSKDLGISETLRALYIDDYVESLLLFKGNNVPGVDDIEKKSINKDEEIEVSLGGVPSKLKDHVVG